jgi:hypothetical protein
MATAELLEPSHAALNPVGLPMGYGGCNAVQGYLVGRPVPASTIRRLLADPGKRLGVEGSLQVIDYSRPRSSTPLR